MAEAILDRSRPAASCRHRRRDGKRRISYHFHLFGRRQCGTAALAESRCCALSELVVREEIGSASAWAKDLFVARAHAEMELFGLPRQRSHVGDSTTTLLKRFDRPRS